VELAGLVFFVFVACSGASSFQSSFPAILIAVSLADGPPGVRGQPAWGVLVVDGPRCLHRRSVIEVQYWRFVSLFRIVPRCLADGPPRHYAGLLSPLLFESCFLFGIVWGLFLELVGPL
jgi:hypothetical protein